MNSWGLAAPLYHDGGYFVPTHDLVDAYEMIDGSAVDPNNPYVGRDPRLDFTIMRPGMYFYLPGFPASYLFDGNGPLECSNHVGQAIKDLAMWKYHDYFQGGPFYEADPGQEDLNFIVLRYADVILSKAEALIETNQNIADAIALINRIRTERDDVKITSLPLGLSQDEARKALRHERRIELACEGLYWADIKRWKIGPELYPMEIRGTNGGLVETRYPNGYKVEKDNLFPIPDGERSLNHNLEQNPGW